MGCKLEWLVVYAFTKGFVECLGCAGLYSSLIGMYACFFSAG